jgi:hypothetical protein
MATKKQRRIEVFNESLLYDVMVQLGGFQEVLKSLHQKLVDRDEEIFDIQQRLVKLSALSERMKNAPDL